VADSSVDPGELTGPRVKHIGPGESDFNDGEEFGSDDPAGEALNSGVETIKPVYEDWCADGVTGYDDPYSGASSGTHDSVSSTIAAAPQTYSWLPGADNSKNLDFYALGLTKEDTEWLKQHSQPDPPPGHGPKQVKPDTSALWSLDF
jgi:hypothetical protein